MRPTKRRLDRLLGDLAYATPADTYASVAAGDGHICAITTAGVLRCWGTDQAGMVSTAPATPAGRRYTYVAAGSVSSCAILDDGSMQCWGNNQSGQLNVPALPTGVQYTRVAVSTSISDLSQAIFHTCALRSDGTAACWGGNNAGQLNVPALPTGLTYTDITVGGPHTCAARSDGAVLCWGHWLYGQTTPPATLNLLKLPQSIVFNPPVPTDVPRNSTFQVVPNAGTSLVLSSTTPAVCTTQGTTVSFIAAGTCSFNADRPADAEYEAAPTLTTNVTVALTAIQKITFTSTPPSEAHVSDTYTVTATGGGSANPVTFSSLSTSTCTVAGNAVTFVAPGDCVVAADQAAADGYFAAPQVTQTIAVTLRSQTIVFTPALPAQDTLGAKLTFGATGGASGNAVTFTVLTPATCAVVGGKLSLTAIGTCTVAADQAGNVAYAAAARVTASVTVRWSFAFVGLTLPPKTNRGKAGQIVDVPFSLGGDRGPNVFAQPAVALAYSCGATPPAVGAGYQQPSGPTTLTYDAKRGRYTYAWQTLSGWVKNCVQLTLTLADGTSRVVIFDFR